MPQLIVLSRDQAEKLTPPCNAAIISIKCAGDTDAQLPEGYKATLRLEFDDVDMDRHVTPGTPVPPEVTLFTRDMAAAVWAWYRKQLAQGIDTVVVHCWMGVSRSPAIALALIGTTDAIAQADRFPMHNRFVRRLMEDEA